MKQVTIGVLLALVVAFTAYAEEELAGELVVVASEGKVPLETRAEKFVKMYEPDDVVTTPAADPAICNPDSTIHCAEVSDDIGTWEMVKEFANATGLTIKVFFVGEEQ